MYDGKKTTPKKTTPQVRGGSFKHSRSKTNTATQRLPLLPAATASAAHQGQPTQQRQTARARSGQRRSDRSLSQRSIDDARRRISITPIGRKQVNRIVVVAGA